MIRDGFNGNEVSNVHNILKQYGVFVVIISDKLGTIKNADGTELKVDYTFLTMTPSEVDSVYVVGGTSRNQMKFDQDVSNFVQNAYTHYKPIGVASTGQSFIQASEGSNLAGVIFARNNQSFREGFVAAIGQQRFWNRR